MRCALVVAICAALGAAAPAAAAPTPHVWQTTPDGAMKMSDRGSAAFHRDDSDALTISVDPSRRYQTMEGGRRSATGWSSSRRRQAPATAS